MTAAQHRSTATPRWPLRFHVALILLAALVLRIAAWWVLPYRGFVSDEAEYVAAATWLAHGRGFSFFQGWIWTRPPLYVLFLAAHIYVFGIENLMPIRFSQAVLSTLSVWLAMRLAVVLAPSGRARRAAVTVGWAMALAYGLVNFAFLMLSETLFITLLLAAVLSLAIWAHRRQLRWLILGGVLLGLGSLTRAVLAGALPLVALWVFWQASRPSPTVTVGAHRRWSGTALRRGVGATALLTVVVSGFILPWSAYNTRFFGANGLILIDTTGGYNAMLGAQAAFLEQHPDVSTCGPRATRCSEMIYNTLIAIPDHADRQATAYRTAARYIADNPGGFVRKSGRELIDLLWVSYSGDERLADGYALGEVPALHLLGLLADDTLYVLAMPLAMLGLVWPQRRPGKGLVIAWLLYNMVTGPLFFAINRFRLPLMPFLVIYAAIGVWQIGAAVTSRPRRIAGWTLAIAMAAVVLPPYLYLPGQWTPNQRRSVLLDTWIGFQGLRDGERCDAIERLMEQGRLAEAQALHDAEDQRKPRTCLALLQAQLLARQGQPEAALELLQRMAMIPERYLLEGNIYRAVGDLEHARGAFVATRLEPSNPTAWAWEHLQPPPTNRIDLGNGLDWGYVDGFYQREWTDPADPFGSGFRWAGPNARLRFVGAGTGEPQQLRLRVAGPRPAAQPPAELGIGVRGEVLKQQQVEPEWQELVVSLPPTPRGGDVIVTLAPSTFVPGPEELQDRQLAREKLRLLGVQVDWAALEPVK